MAAPSSGPDRFRLATDFRPDFTDISLPELPDIPGMIKREEGQYLYWLARTASRDDAVVAEIGTWLGRSSIHLAAGLVASGRAGRVQCYDHFEWAGGANWNLKGGGEKEAGSDFMPDFLENVAPYRDRIDAHKAKIRDIVFGPKPIAAIALDAPKRIADISAVLQALSGRIIPGHTILAWQDFLHPASFEIPAALAAMSGHLEAAHVVSSGTLVAFRALKGWNPDEVAPERLSFRGWSAERARVVWDMWDPVVPEVEKPSFRSGLAMLLSELGHTTQACAELESVLHDRLTQIRWTKWRTTSLRHRYSELFALPFPEAAS